MSDNQREVDDSSATLNWKNFDAPGLLEVVDRTVHRSQRFGTNEGGKCIDEAISAVTLSAVVLEGFINELGEMARLYHPVGMKDPILVSLGDLITSLEDSHGSPKTKYLLASQILSNTTGQGGPEIEHLSLLFDLRNAIMHLKPKKRTKLLEKLGRHNLLANDSSDDHSWITQMATRATAEWSLKTASTNIDRIINMLPDGALKTLARTSMDRRTFLVIAFNASLRPPN